MAINFSRSASQIIGQYYVFMRNGFEGYKEIHMRTMDVAHHLVQGIKDLGIFIMYEEATEVPILCWSLDPKAGKKWTLYDPCLSAACKHGACHLPAYRNACRPLHDHGRQVLEGHESRDREPR